MKKILLLLSALVSTLCISAQGTWSTGTIEADDLKDEKGGVYYRYDVEGVGSIILRDWKDWDFKIITESGEFDSFEMNDNISHGMFYTFGYYTDDNKLEFKFKDDRGSQQQAISLD